MKTIILMSGYKGSGKDFGGEVLKSKLEKDGLNVDILKFASELKDLTKKSFKPMVVEFDEMIDEFTGLVNSIPTVPVETRIKLNTLINKLKIKDHNFYEEKTAITRILLQVVGTDVAHHINNQIWVENVAKQIDASDKDVFIITDTRFPKEIEFLEEYEFYDQAQMFTVRINPSTRKIDRADSHISETALDDYAFNFTVNNDFDETFEVALDNVYNIMNLSFE